MVILAAFLVFGINNNLDGQAIPKPTIDMNIDSLSYKVYRNGTELKFGKVLVAFIYGDNPFGFKGDGFQIIIITGDTLEIKLKRKL